MKNQNKELSEKRFNKYCNVPPSLDNEDCSECTYYNEHKIMKGFGDCDYLKKPSYSDGACKYFIKG